MGFVTFATGSDVELDALAFIERLVPLASNAGVVHEDVVAAFARDEAETLVGVEELDRALCHSTRFTSRPIDDFNRLAVRSVRTRANRGVSGVYDQDVPICRNASRSSLPRARHESLGRIEVTRQARVEEYR